MVATNPETIRSVFAAVLVLECLLLSAGYLAYRLSIKGYELGGEAVRAKIFVLYWAAWPLVMAGLIFSGIGGVIFVAFDLTIGARVPPLTQAWISVIFFMAMGWVAIAQTVWLWFTIKGLPLEGK